MKEILTETLHKSGAAVCDKIKGFPKPLYTKVMLDDAIKTISGMSEREIYMRILNAKSRESRAKERRGV